MCGIFGYIGPDDQAASIVLEGLKRLEYRGYDSWGVAVTSAGTKISVKKRVGKIGFATVDDLPTGSLAIGHTRWATHGGVTEENSHPHLDCSGSVAVIHNGIVENYEKLKNELIHKGHVFTSETDTEVIAHLLEEALKSGERSFEEAFRLVFTQLEGLNAVIAINKSERIILAARQGSPLVLGLTPTAQYLASDPAALLPITKEVYFLEDGEMAAVSDSNIVITTAQTGHHVTWKTQILDWDVTQTELGEFPHFMLKEIYEQPRIVAGIAASSLEQTKRMAAVLSQADRTYLLGCGSASYMAIVGTYLLAKVAGQHAEWCVGSEFTYKQQFLSSKSAIIALSQSGETMDTLESLKLAKQKGAQILALVNVLGSSLYRMADEKILLGAGPEKAVASTKAVAAKIAHLLMLAYTMADKAELGRELLDKATKAISEVLQGDSIERIKSVAKKLQHSEHIYVIGRGLSYAVSLETAIKIKEITYIHAEGLMGGELKHGPLALIKDGTPCIVLAPQDETFMDNISSAMEVKARGGYIIGISPTKHDAFDEHISFDDVKDASILPMTVIAQLLAYHLAVLLELDPDKPRNLAKSVTVK